MPVNSLYHAVSPSSGDRCRMISARRGLYLLPLRGIQQVHLVDGHHDSPPLCRNSPNQRQLLVRQALASNLQGWCLSSCYQCQDAHTGLCLAEIWLSWSAIEASASASASAA